MMRGIPISSRPEAGSQSSTEETRRTEPAQVPAQRTLTTAEANEFLNRAPGFLEKRRSSGIDSPRYIQTRPKGLVRYRVEDLLVWEESKMRQNTSYEG